MVVHLVHLKEIQRALQMVPQKGVHLEHLMVNQMADWMGSHWVRMMASNLVM